ncbi:MAG: SRPBCC domain-containing protein [Niabella sp.]
MKELKFSKEINAPIQKVWDILWNEDTYGKWTRFFTEGSRMESDWQVGGRTVFLDPDGNGMIATITELDVPRKVYFSHQGHIIKGVEDTTSDEVKAFAGALEKYDLEEKDGTTYLEMSVEVFEDFEQMMINGFTKGIAEVKKLAEEG